MVARVWTLTSMCGTPIASFPRSRGLESRRPTRASWAQGEKRLSACWPRFPGAPWLAVVFLLAPLSALAQVAEPFDALDYVFPRAPLSAGDGLSFALDGSASLVLQKGAKVAGMALQWQVPAVSEHAVVAITRGLADPPDIITVWVKNPYGHGVGLALAAVLADGSLAVWPPVDLADSKSWREVTWPAAISQANARLGLAPRLPIKEWRLMLCGLQPGSKYTVFLDEFSVRVAAPQTLSVQALSAPVEVRAGDSLLVRVVLEGTPAVSPFCVPLIELRDSAGLVAASRPLRLDDAPRSDSVGRTIEALLSVPAGLPAGAFRLVLAGPGLEITGPAAVGAPVAVTSRRSDRSPPPTSFPPRLVADLTSRAISAVTAVGPHVYLLPLNCGWDPYGASVNAPDDASAVVTACDAVNAVLQLDPSAAVIPSIYLGASPEWCAAHADECMVHHPTLDPEACLAPRLRSFPSWSSQTWRESASDQLRKLIDALECAPWSVHLLGYLLSSGEDGTWAYFEPSQKALPDYSPPQKRAFRDFLKARYKSMADLRSAWGQARQPVLDLLEKAPPDEPRPLLSWGEVSLPAPERRLKAPMSLLEPPAMQDLIDCRDFHAQAAAAAALAFAEVARAVCPDKPIGLCYGSWMLDAEDPRRIPTGAHTALEALLASDAVDFLAVQAPEGVLAGVPPLPTASMSLRDKAWVALLPGATAAGAGIEGTTLPSRLFAAASALAQGASTVVAAPEEVGSSAWQALATGVDNPVSAGPGPDVGVLADAASALCVASPDVSRELLSRQLLELSRAGVAYDVWLLADAPDRRIRERRAYFLLNSFLLSDRQREDVSFLRGRNHLLVFTHAAGALRPNSGISGRNMFGLTGLSATPLPGGKPLRVKALAGIDPWTSGLQDDVVYGPRASVSPWFGCVDGGSEVLGYIEGKRVPGLVARRFDGWNSVYSVAPGLPAPLLASLMETAGVHRYTDAGVRLAVGHGLLAIMSEATGSVSVRLPEKTRVRHLTDAGWAELGVQPAVDEGQVLVLSLQSE